MRTNEGGARSSAVVIIDENKLTKAARFAERLQEF